MLASKFGVSPETILVANNLSNPDLLQEGQELVIPPTTGVLHVLKDGESLRKIADRYNVDLAEILEANDFGGTPDLVQAGAEVMVPGADPLSALVQSGGNTDQRIASIGGVGVPLSQAAQRSIPSTRTYEVVPGDTLATIADRFGVDVDTLLGTNGINDADRIKPGVELRILPVKGIEYEVKSGETLADIAFSYQVDLGILLDYNDLDNPDMIRSGLKLLVPGGKFRPAPPPIASAPAPRASAPSNQAAAPAQPKPAARPAVVAADPEPIAGPGGGNVLANAMKYLGYRYVFGGTSPAGFDCSGFVYYIHRVSGSGVGRGMWQQYNGGPHVSQPNLQPGDTVFYANTYMPGLSHNGIYIGGGQFIHASDESTGVTVSSMGSAYWSSRYVGATRLY